MKIPSDSPWKLVDKTLGKGGQSDVHLVVNRDEATLPNPAKYALKALRKVENLQARTRFTREIEIVKGLDHPAIVKVLDNSSENDEFQFYVMEYHEDARSLDKVIFSDSNPFHGDILLSLDLFEKIVSVIDFCSERLTPITHRDISPKNILLLKDMSIKLIDFGICQVDVGDMITLTDEGFGTRNYTSPECESGTEGLVGVKSDIYSASKVLWSAITSQCAFAFEEPVFRNKSMRAIFPHNHDTWHLSHIFKETIRKNPEDRVSNAKEMKAQIARVRSVVKRGFPPLELIGSYCPSCGWYGYGVSVEELKEEHRMPGQPNSDGVIPYKCAQCGFIFARDVTILRNRSENMSRLR